MKTQGRRAEAGDSGLPVDHRPGDYWRTDHGWYALLPNGLLANLNAHAVEEHPDGTITVSPSILTGNGGRQWHGFLRAGVFEEC
jgi:hypothetical protein